MEYLLKGIGCLVNCSRISYSWAASCFYRQLWRPWFGLQSKVFCLMFHLLHFAAVSAVPCGWERSAHAPSGADSSALTCILYSLYFPAHIQKIFCVVSYQKQYTVCSASLPCFLQIFHRLASLYRSSTDFHFCFYRCSFLSMTWRQLGSPRQPKELLLCRNCRS